MNQRVFVLIHKQLQLHTQLTAVMQQCFVGTGNARRPAVEVQMRLVVELTDLGVAYFVNQIAMAYRKNPPATAMRGLENSALITCPGKLIGRCQPRNPPPNISTRRCRPANGSRFGTLAWLGAGIRPSAPPTPNTAAVPPAAATRLRNSRRETGFDTC